MKAKKILLFLVFIFSLFYFSQYTTQSKPIFIEQSKNNILLLQKSTSHLQKAVITPLNQYKVLSKNNVKNENIKIYFNPPLNISFVTNKFPTTPKKL